jgi:hypothetical protein
MAALVKVIDDALGLTDAVLGITAAASLLVGAESIGQSLTGLPERVLSLPSGREGRGIEVFGRAPERGFVVTLARFRGPVGEMLAQDDVVSIALQVFDPRGVQIDVEDLANTEVFEVNPRTDLGWTGDRIGWNFRHEYNGRQLRHGGGTYRLEYRIVDTSERVYALRHSVKIYSLSTVN